MRLRQRLMVVCMDLMALSLAVGRENWFSAGSDNNGQTVAMLFSIYTSCKRHGVDPFVWMRGCSREARRTR